MEKFNGTRIKNADGVCCLHPYYFGMYFFISLINRTFCSVEEDMDFTNSITVCA